MSRKSKRRIRRGILAAAAAVAIAALAGGIAAGVTSTGKSKTEKSTSNVNISDAGSIVSNQVEVTRDSTWDSLRVDSTVEIQMDDFAAVVGTQLKVIAEVTPANTEQSLVWNSSDNAVFTVTNEGVVVIRGKGTGVLTATVGNVSDSIVIEGIEAVSQGTVNDLPIYTASNGDISYYYSDGSDTQGVPSTTEGTAVASNPNTDGDVSNGGTNTGSDTGYTSDGGSYEGTGTVGSDTVLDGNSYNANLNPTGGNGGYDSSNVGEVLPSAGFQQALSNVYIYYEGDKYCGEIVTQSDATIIYIKERSTGFDNKVISVVSSMIPDSYMQVWNTYQTANTDKTFVADNKKVRIVVAQGDGHSQIVIYN